MTEIFGFIFGVVGTVVGTVLAVFSYRWGTESERRRQRDAEKAYAQRAHPGEVIVVSNILEPDEENPGGWLLKPRTLVSEMALATAFPNPALLARLEAAITCCDPSTPEGSFIKLSSDEERASLMKRVVNMVSAEGAIGHICRMFELPIVKKEAFAVFTFSRDGDDRKVRIDFLSGGAFERFGTDPLIMSKLRYRPEEGSHDDTAAIFQFAAVKHFAARVIKNMEERAVAEEQAALYVRRVSLPVPLAMTLSVATLVRILRSLKSA